MAKVTVALCDVKPCTRPAAREFELNGETVYVCGENCFVKFWSREFASWKAAPYKMQVFQDSILVEASASEAQVIDLFHSDLHLVKSSGFKLGGGHKN